VGPLLDIIPTIASSEEARGRVRGSGRTGHLVYSVSRITMLETEFAEYSLKKLVEGV